MNTPASETLFTSSRFHLFTAVSGTNHGSTELAEIQSPFIRPTNHQERHHAAF
jgi:hypothetical protein